MNDLKPLDVYLCGVGGQGIGTLSEVLLRSCLAAGYEVFGADTHGLAQRGGIVRSQMRLGRKRYCPLIPPGEADIVIALERLEGVRAAVNMLKAGGTVICFDTAQQPMTVRSGEYVYPDVETLEKVVKAKDGRLELVTSSNLPDPRMQNTALLSRIASIEAIPGVTPDLVESELRRVLKPQDVEKNLEVFQAGLGARS
jgi:indolepyruvate ferredoxin oxidoreductase beta subunit